jgi:hypothetical protein
MKPTFYPGQTRPDLDVVTTQRSGVKKGSRSLYSENRGAIILLLFRIVIKIEVALGV